MKGYAALLRLQLINRFADLKPKNLRAAHVEAGKIQEYRAQKEIEQWEAEMALEQLKRRQGLV